MLREWENAKLTVRNQMVPHCIQFRRHQIFKLAAKEGIAKKTLRDAASSIEVRKHKTGFDSGWWWALPDDETPEDDHPEPIN